MLDAPDLDYADVLAAVERWRPDPQCLAAGVEHALLAVRCFAAAGLSDQQIARRMLDLAGVSSDVNTAPVGDRSDAARAVARLCAIMDLPLRHIIAILAYLAAEVPGWPDADENAAIAQAAVAEFA